MTERLLAIAGQINNGSGVIDVGTDHALVPVYLAKHGYTGRIYASDINSGPLSAARRSAEEAGVAERIEFLLCDGLDGADSETIDTVVIAGMGGELICRIIDRAEWCMSPEYKLILQPMTKAEVLRYWLVNNEFSIEREELVEDGGTLYQLITARFGKSAVLSDAELFTGKIDLVCGDPLFKRQLDSLIVRFERALDGSRQSAKRSAAKESLYEGILRQLKEMKHCDNK